MPESHAPVEALPEGGTVRPMTRWGEDVMHRPARPVTVFDDDLRALAADMTATMHAADGVGLAACQIGVDLALFVYDCPDDDGVRHVGAVCNPRVELPEGRERKLDDGDEGCLSYPGAFIGCARPDLATVHGQDLDGNEITLRGTGFLARCFQHETDHTLGTVFGDRISDRARKRLRKQMEAAAEDYPADWPAGT